MYGRGMSDTLTQLVSVVYEYQKVCRENCELFLKLVVDNAPSGNLIIMAWILTTASFAVSTHMSNQVVGVPVCEKDSILVFWPTGPSIPLSNTGTVGSKG
jgi:hypothetical protein